MGRYIGCRRLSNMKAAEGEVAVKYYVTSVHCVVSIDRIL